jgi:hypothetical protein
MFCRLLSISSIGLLLLASGFARAGEEPAAEPVQEDVKDPVVQKEEVVQEDAVQKGAGGGVQYIERTVCCPQWVTEMRKVTVTQYRQEEREVTETVYHCQPVEHEVERRCTVMVPEIRKKTVQ